MGYGQKGGGAYVGFYTLHLLGGENDTRGGEMPLPPLNTALHSKNLCVCGGGGGEFESLGRKLFLNFANSPKLTPHQFFPLYGT